MGILRRAARRSVTDSEDQFHQPGTLKGNARIHFRAWSYDHNIHVELLSRRIKRTRTTPSGFCISCHVGFKLAPF